MSAAPSRTERDDRLLACSEAGDREFSAFLARSESRRRQAEIRRLEAQLGYASYGGGEYRQADLFGGREITRDRGLYGGGTGDW